MRVSSMFLLPFSAGPSQLGSSSPQYANSVETQIDFLLLGNRSGPPLPGTSLKYRPPF